MAGPYVVQFRQPERRRVDTAAGVLSGIARGAETFQRSLLDLDKSRQQQQWIELSQQRIDEDRRRAYVGTFEKAMTIWPIQDIERVAPDAVRKYFDLAYPGVKFEPPRDARTGEILETYAQAERERVLRQQALQESREAQRFAWTKEDRKREEDARKELGKMFGPRSRMGRALRKGVGYRQAMDAAVLAEMRYRLRNPGKTGDPALEGFNTESLPLLVGLTAGGMRAAVAAGILGGESGAKFLNILNEERAAEIVQPPPTGATTTPRAATGTATKTPTTKGAAVTATPAEPRIKGVIQLTPR